MSMHENLMDLPLTYLHANTIGTPDYAGAPYELDLKEATTGWYGTCCRPPCRRSGPHHRPRRLSPTAHEKRLW